MRNPTIILKQVLLPLAIGGVVFFGGYFVWSMFAKECSVRTVRYEHYIAASEATDKLNKKNGRESLAELNNYRMLATGDQYTMVGNILFPFEKAAGPDALRRVALKKPNEAAEGSIMKNATTIEVAYDGTFRGIQQAFLNLEKRRPNMLLTSLSVTAKPANPTVGYTNPYVAAVAQYFVFVNNDASPVSEAPKKP